jgi:flagella basal body P-ring formation protein FlgA
MKPPRSNLWMVCLIAALLIGPNLGCSTARDGSKPRPTALPKGKVVCPVQNIKAGAPLSPQMLQERDIDLILVPIDSVPSATYLADKKTRFDLEPGHIICQHDLALPLRATLPPTRALDPAEVRTIVERSNWGNKTLFATKDIPRGTIFTTDLLEEREVFNSQIPYDAITVMSLAVGRAANFDIPSGSVISQHDLTTAGKFAQMKPGKQSR